MMTALLRILLSLSLLLPLAVRADRGAVAVEGGGTLSFLSAPPAVGDGDSVAGTLVGAYFGARYDLTHHIQLRLAGTWLKTADFFNDNTTVANPNGGTPLTGQLQSTNGRWTATAGAYYTFGNVWKVFAGGEVGWGRYRYTDLQLVNPSTSPPSVYGIELSNQTVNALLLVASGGVQWDVTDKLSVTLSPRFEVPVTGDPKAISFTVPLYVSWSWYGLL